MENKNKKMEREDDYERRVKKHEKVGGYFIPIGIFFGLGIAFAYYQVWIVAGVLLGLGFGFIGMMLYLMSQLKKEEK
jgi:fatty acid desaturase